MTTGVLSPAPVVQIHLVPDMRTFAVNQNNDIFVGGDGNLAIAHDQDAVKFTCEQFARAARNEMIHKMNSGMPFFDVVFGQNANIAQYEAAFRRRMSEIREVVAVVSFTGEIQDNVLRYTADINTIYGTVRINNGTANVPE